MSKTNVASEARPEGRPESPETPPSTNGALPHQEDPWDRARQWVEANQTLALVGSFALGVFLGVLIRR